MDKLGNSVKEFSSVALQFSPMQIDYSDYPKRFIDRINEVYVSSLLRSAMAGRLYKLQSKHTSNSGFDQTLMPCSGYIFYSLPNNEWGTKYHGLTYSAKYTVREICRATYSARQARFRMLFSQRRR